MSQDTEKMIENPYVTFNKRFPIVEVTFTGNKANDNNFQAYLDELASCYEDRKELGIIFDARNAVFPSLKYVRQQAFWLDKNWNLMNSYCVGTAYVISSLPIRIALRLIFSFQRQPVDYVVVKSNEEAESWLDSRFQKASATER